MDNSSVAQQLKTLAVCGGGLVVAALIGWNIGSSNYIPSILVCAIPGIVAIALFSGRSFWIVVIASSFLGGTFPILGGSFTPFQILMGIGIAKFIVEDIVLRRHRLRLGNSFDLFFIAGFMAIITLHGIHDRFGMRFLGSSIWGGRNYVNLYVGLAAFFVIQSIPFKPKLWARLPYAILAVTGFDLIIALITTISPASIYKIYPFYSAVSTAGIVEILTGSGVDTARLGSFGNFGVALITLVLASVSLRRILMPPLFLRMVALAVGFAGVLYSSFRTNVFNTIAVVFIAGIRDLKLRVLVILPLIIALLFGLSVINLVFPLPKQMQRSLAFMPGKWNTEMQRDAGASNEFRGNLWTFWEREYFPRHPWLGRGFGFRIEEATPSMYHPGEAFDFRQFVEVGNLHNGFFSCIDAFGIAGTVFFVAWNLRLLFQTFRVPFRDTAPNEQGLRFLALCLGASILCYWLGAPNVGTFLPREFALAGVFIGLNRAAKSDSTLASHSASKHAQTLREELATA